MAQNELHTGGWGTYSAYDLDIFQIDEASRSDFERVSEVEARRDGWRDYRDMMAEMKADIEAELPALRENFKSRAGEVYAEALGEIVTASEEHRAVAETNRESTDAIAAEVRRVRPLIRQIMTDRALAVDNRNALEAIPQDGSDAYTQAMDDTLFEARRTFAESNSTYGEANSRLAPPAEYDGPMYTGPDPKTPLGGDYRHAYNSDGTPYRGDGDTGGVAGSRPGAPVPGGSGPELQNPGGAPPPASAPAPPGPGPSGPGQGTVPAPYVPTGPGGPPVNPGPGPVKPVTPVGGKPPTGPATGAKPTPGMTKPGPGGPGGKPGTAPLSSKGTGPKSSLLPNQRRAAGKTPMTGSGRVPASAGGSGSRSVGPGNSARTGSAPAVGGRGGAARPKPNAVVGENLYRGPRAARTVPGVIGGRGGEAVGSGTGRSGAGRPAAAGKVFGERKSKRRAAGGSPKLQSGSLTGSAGGGRNPRPSGQRTPVEPPHPVAEGPVAFRRSVPKRPTTDVEVAEAKLQARKRWRRQFYESQREPRPEPASELFGGTEGRVTRGVIRGAGAERPTDRREAGTGFSSSGWEDD